MEKNYRAIMLKMDFVIREIYEIGELAESTSFFPVRSYINLQERLEDFYQDLRGASKKATDFNIEDAKKRLNNDFGFYVDTDSFKYKKKEDGHQD